MSRMARFLRYPFHWLLGQGREVAAKEKEHQSRDGGNWKPGSSSALNWLSHSGQVAFCVCSLICEMRGGPPMKSVVRFTEYEVL